MYLINLLYIYFVCIYCIFILRSIFGHMRLAEMVNYKKLVLKAITKRNALAAIK